MLGAIIGDIVGSRFEFDNHRRKDFDLFTNDCHVTDDTVMTLAVAQAIMDTDEAICRDNEDYYPQLSNAAVYHMRDIGQNYPHCGYGGNFAHWIYSPNPQPYNSYGNGAAMRVSPAAFAARNEAEALKLSDAVTAVTHNHPEGIKGAQATTIAIYLAKFGATIPEIADRIHRDYYPQTFTIDQIRPRYRFNETCQLTVPQAIQCFLESTSFEDAIRTAISLGGDSDTIAAITGAIAQAFYGVPDDIGNTALTYLDDRLRAIYDRWVDSHGCSLTNNRADCY